MFDHIDLNASDFERSRAFYAAVLAPLGHSILHSGDGWAVLGSAGSYLWLGSHGPASGHMHIGLRAETRAQVDAFHRAALAAGGHDNGGPGLRPDDSAIYYAAFVLDPDGHNVEAVCRDPG